jgi:hypothetical protein
MNIQEKIDGAMSRNTNRKLPTPSRICSCDDDYIYYASYCSNAISLLKIDLLTVNFHQEDFNQEVRRITKKVDDIHLLIALCYQALKLSGKNIESKVADVFTTTMSHERRV